ncbi:MAG: M24 family metallopeptidase [Candidatus Omnitrophica bacterium]|nr:M24 family metallopeptidase [Candidatus Omnitrophota bacterium]
MITVEEFTAKFERMRSLIQAKGVGALILSRRSNFAWLSCGGENYVVSSSEGGVGSLVVTPEKVYCLTTNIEVHRFLEEELDGLPVEGLPYPWYEASEEPGRTLSKIVDGNFIGADGPGWDLDLSAEMVALRYPLFPPEVDRYRSLGAKTAILMSEVCRSLKPGMTELTMAADLEKACTERGLEAYVRLIAFDERIDRYRHPIPTEKELEARAMVVLCAREKGLIINLTRMVNLKPVDADLKRRHEACCRIDTALNLASKPGVALSEIFQQGVHQYEAEGFPEEWKLHHQGGTTGYEGRDYFGNPTASEVLTAPSAVAWNPSIRGTKSEDTFLVTEQGVENLCESKDWPQIESKTDLGTLKRCDILEL